MNRLFLMGLLLGWTSTASAETVAIVVAEDDATGVARYWWHCNGDRPALPVTDVLTAHFRKRGATVVSGCDALDQPVHKSYHRAKLGRHAVVNLGNALGADRIVFGSVSWKSPNAGRLATSIGLTRRDVSARLTVIDLMTEKNLATLDAKATGFASGAPAARERATGLLVSRLFDGLPKLVKPAPQSTGRLAIRLEGITPIQLDRHIDGLRSLRAVRTVTINELERRAAVLIIRPITARKRAERYLENAGAQYRTLP